MSSAAISAPAYQTIAVFSGLRLEPVLSVNRRQRLCGNDVKVSATPFAHPERRIASYLVEILGFLKDGNEPAGNA